MTQSKLAVILHADVVGSTALVAEFDRASDAVNAELAFQRDNRVENESLSDDIRPEVRVGIALG